MDEANGKMRSKHEDVDAASLSADILNPFVHRLELDTTYDKLKVSSSPNPSARGKPLRNRCSHVRTQTFQVVVKGGAGNFTLARWNNVHVCHFLATTLCTLRAHMPVCVQTNLKRLPSLLSGS
ncbi:hypothetical protein K0M31_005694 [Melipona bicolor]|uniref:Uncharacterized protein n=1 Tax=Melipona bicolor TaxID=60889 RepID=A0AA40KM10_9HYME|nr:hypothetical protein K0M31_005694 [Melipona bicolor]